MDGGTAIVLCGGLGKRLRGVLGEHTPKALAPVRGRPFLAYLLDQLVDAKAERIILCTGWRGARIRAFARKSWRGIPLVYSHEYAPIGTAGALRLAANHLGTADPVLVVNGDTFVESGPATVWRRFHGEPRANLMLGFVQVQNAARYQTVVLDMGTNQVVELPRGRVGRQFVSTGIVVLRRSVLGTMLPEDSSFDLDVLPQWTRRGLYGTYLVGDFVDVGTPETYKAAQGMPLAP